MAFGQTSPSYRTPQVNFDVAGAAWLSDAAVSSWSIDRELVGSTIPGNIRSANGLSIGAASVSLVNSGERVTPYSPNPDRLVSSGGSATLSATEDGVQLPLGSWVVAPTSGALSTRGIDIDLYEAQYAGRGMAQALEPLSTSAPMVPFDPNARVDPCWTAGRLAAQAGFDAIPRPVASALLAAPLHGGIGLLPTSLYPLTPFQSTGLIAKWELLTGDVAVGAGGTSYCAFTSDRPGGDVVTPLSNALTRDGSIFLTLNATGEVHLWDPIQGWYVKIVNNPDSSTFTLAVSNDGIEPAGPGVSFAGQQSDDWPTRVQVELERDWSGTQWTETRGRVRSGESSAWTSWTTHAANYSPVVTYLDAPSIGAGLGAAAPGQFAGLQITTEADPALWTPSKAHLKPLGGDVGIPWVPADLDVWDAIRDVCSAWLGAAIVGTDGILRMLDRDDLAGANSTGEVTDIGHDWTDLPWELDPDDSVDRVAITVTAPTIRNAMLGSSTKAPAAWRADEVISVPGGATVKIPVVFDNAAAVGVFRSFVQPSASPDPQWSTYSFVSAYSNPEGTGAQVANTQIGVQVEQTSATTAVVTYSNRSAQTQYLVTDADLPTGGGEPSLIVNAASVATYTTPQVIERGLPAGEAQRALEVDLTPWVQRTQDAEEIANYLWSRLSGTRLWKVNSVRVRLDWTHDLGKVLRLVHSKTGLEAKALITKVHYDGQPGEVAQTLDLVLLPWTFADFNAAWNALDPAATFADFNTAQGTTRTFRDMAADNNWTGA